MQVGRYTELLIYLGNVVVAIGVGLLIGAVIMLLGGYDPVKAYQGLFATSLNIFDPYYVSTTLSYATPVILTGLAFAISARAGIFNIGAEGQLYMGALGAVIVAWLGVPPPYTLAAAIMLGIALGTLWSLIAGVLKAFRNVNEVVSTIMLNWIAFWIVEYARTYVLGDPLRQEKTISMPPWARIPLIVEGTELSYSFVVAIATAILIYVLLWRTKLGYYIRVTGSGRKTAMYAGIDPRIATLAVFALGGAVSGLAGVLEVCGRPPTYAITTGASNIAGLGFSGITVSLLGLNHPLLILPASIVVGALMAGARGMQIFAGVPLEIVMAVQGIIMVALSIPSLMFIYRRWVVRKALRGGESA